MRLRCAYRKFVVLVFAGLWSLSLVAQAQILIGQTAGLSGDGSARMVELNRGAQLAFDEINQSGGIQGSLLKLVSLDDERKDQKSIENVRRLKEQGVIALLLARSTTSVEAIKPELLALKLPLIGPATGAISLHQPVHPYLFNVRATYQTEAKNAIRQLHTTGVTEIALLYQADAFGKDAVKGAQNEIAARQMKPFAEIGFERKLRDFKAIAVQVKAAQAVLAVASSESVVEIVKTLRQMGSSAQVVTLSNNSSDTFSKELGQYGHGVIVSQVVPNLSSSQFPVAFKFSQLAAKHGTQVATPAMLEGYLSSLVLIEGLRRIKGKVTSSALVNALNTFNNVDFGGLKISYSPEDHSGLTFSELSIINKSGQYLR